MGSAYMCLCCCETLLIAIQEAQAKYNASKKELDELAQVLDGI